MWLSVYYTNPHDTRLFFGVQNQFSTNWHIESVNQCYLFPEVRKKYLNEDSVVLKTFQQKLQKRHLSPQFILIIVSITFWEITGNIKNTEEHAVPAADALRNLKAAQF